MDPQLLIPLAAAVVAIGLHWLGARRSRQALKKLEDEHGRLPAVLDEKSPGRRIEGSTKTDDVRDGFEYRWEYYEGDGNVPPYLVVTLLADSNGDFVVSTGTAKGPLQRILIRWGVTSIHTGDEDFDRTYDLESMSTPGFASACFQSADCRAAVRRLFDLGFTAVRNDRLGFDAISVPFQERSESPAALAGAALPSLCAVRDHAATVPRSTFLGLSSDTAKWVLAFVLPVALFAVASVLMFVQVAFATCIVVDEFTRMVLFPIPFIIPLLIPLLALLFWLARGRIGSLPHLAVVWSLACMASWFLGAALTMFLNASLDRGPQTVRLCRIVDWGVNDHGSHYVDVRSWRPEKRVQTIFLSRDEYNDMVDYLDDDGFVQLTTKPGRFGFEWISGYRIPEEEPTYRSK